MAVPDSQDLEQRALPRPKGPQRHGSTVQLDLKLAEQPDVPRHTGTMRQPGKQACPAPSAPPARRRPRDNSILMFGGDDPERQANIAFLLIFVGIIAVGGLTIWLFYGATF